MGRGPLAALVCSVLAGCVNAPADDEAFAREAIAELRAGRMDELEARLAPELRAPGTREQLHRAGAEFPLAEPDSVTLVAWRSMASVSRGERTTQLALQYVFDGELELVLASVIVVRRGAGPEVRGIHVQRLPPSALHAHDFTLSGKGPIHLLVLFLAVASPVVVLAALGRCLFWSGLRLRDRFLWAIFIAVGVGGITLDWTSGVVSASPLGVHLLGASAARPSTLAPWLLTVSFPLGAVAFLTRRLWSHQKRMPPAAT